MRLLIVVTLLLIWLVNLQLLTGTGVFVGKRIVPTGREGWIGEAASSLPTSHPVCRYFTGLGFFDMVIDNRGGNSSESICPWFLDLRRQGR